MSKLLHIEASPRKARSFSLATAGAFLDAYRTAHTHDIVETLDIWQASLPEFTEDVLNAKYAVLHGQTHTAEQAAAWQGVVAVTEHFKQFDKYLFSVPMWNFGIPYKLKHYIDILTQPGLTFAFSPESGYTGLVTGKPATVIYARGGEYGTAAPIDHQKAYLDLVLGFIGFTDIRTILVEPTLMAPSQEELREKVATTAAEAAQTF